MARRNETDSIKNWAEDERPREKMMAHGAASLSNAELLAILVGSGVPGKSAVAMMHEVLDRYDDKLSLLSKATVQDLMEVKGIGEAKAITVLAACQLTNKRLEEETPKKMRVQTTEDVRDYFRPKMQDLTVEECHLLMLNQKCQVIGSVMLSHGGVAQASVDVREMLRHALLHQAMGVILCHNHPSGNPQPSADDDRLTRSAQQACAAVGIRFLDHVVFGSADEYYSYQDKGKL